MCNRKIIVLFSLFYTFFQDIEFLIEILAVFRKAFLKSKSKIDQTVHIWELFIVNYGDYYHVKKGFLKAVFFLQFWAFY